MKFDELQQTWQSQEGDALPRVNADLLLKEMQRNQRDLGALISLLDFANIGLSLLLLAGWIYMGVTLASPWTWYLMVPANLWIIGFILVYRMRHKQKPSEPGEPLLECVKRSLAQVEDQIWLGRNAFWWSMLPTAIPLLAFTAHVSWLKASDLPTALSDVNAWIFVFLWAFFYALYYISQLAMGWGGNGSFEVRRQELLALLESLGEESTAQNAAVSRANRSSVSRAKSVESSKQLRRWIVAVSCLVTLGAIALASGIFDSSYEGPPQGSGPAGDSLASLVTHERKEKNLVGLAAMVTVDGQVEAAAVQGERKHGSGVPLEISDSWHVGGITKSMTATMIARLIESGQMKWSDTLGEIFPEASIHEDWKPVTLKQLLTDTAGAPPNLPREIWHLRPALGSECTKARRKAVLDVLAEKPDYPPGERFAYSNVGYTIAAAMVEQVTGTAWEDLMKREVFAPLKLTSAGFGPPKSSDETLEQPRGHRKVLGGKFSVDDEADNTPIIGPAGTVRMTLDDLSTFAREHMLGERGEGTLLSTETYKLLHTPERSYYAYGWIRKEPTASFPHTVYWHNGSNTLWYALVVFIPEKNMVVAVTSNDGDFEKAEDAAWEVVRASARQFKHRPDAPGGERTTGAGYPKRSPFSAIRWRESQPEVKVPEIKVADEWYKLVSLDELPAEEIVAFSQRTNGDQWQMRFEEDLVELLTRMGHPPGETVKLVVQSLTSLETQVLEDVPMTAANRWMIKAAAISRENSKP